MHSGCFSLGSVIPVGRGPGRRTVLGSNAPGWAKVQGRGEWREVNHISGHFILSDQCGQMVELIIYATKNGSLKGLCLALS